MTVIMGMQQTSSSAALVKAVRALSMLVFAAAMLAVCGSVGAGESTAATAAPGDGKRGEVVTALNYVRAETDEAFANFQRNAGEK